MNHIVISFPRNKKIESNASTYFDNCTNKSTKNFSLLYYQESAFSIDNNFFVCGNLLNKDARELLLGNSFSQLEGFFVASIFENNTVKVVNDLFGFQHLYVYEKNGLIVYSTSLDFLALHLPVSINWDAWSDIFTYNMILEGATQFNEIKLVGHGSLIEINKSHKRTKYYDYFSWKEKKWSKKQYLDQLHKSFDSYFQKYVKGKEVIVPLSGGTDSRLMATMASKIAKVRCFSTSKDEGKFGDASEIKIARQVARSLHLNFDTINQPPDYFTTYFHQSQLDLNFSCSMHTWYYHFLDNVPIKNKILVDGLGDSIFKSTYVPPRAIELAKNKKWSKLQKELRNLYSIVLCSKFTNNLELDYFEDKIKEKLSLRTDESFKCEFSTYPKSSNLPYFFVANTRYRRKIGTYVTLIASKQFRALSPYFGRNVIELLFSIPGDMRSNNKLLKEYAKKYYPKLFNIPTTTSLHPTKRFMETLLFNISMIFPSLGKKIVLGKDKFLSGSDQYSVRTYNELRDLYNRIPLSPFKNEKYLKILDSYKPGPTKIDVIVKIISFELWYMRYFKKDLSIFGR